MQNKDVVEIRKTTFIEIFVETRRPFKVWPVITVFPDADSRCTEPAVDEPSPSL